MTAATVRLYDLAEAREILSQFLEETEGEVTPEIEALLDQLDGQVTEKVERVGLYIREQVVTAAAIKEEEQRLSARRKALERAVEGLKNYLQRQMERLGKTKVDGLLCTVALQKSPPSVRCTLDGFGLVQLLESGDETKASLVTLVPESYKVNGTAVLAAYKAGQELPNGIAVEQGQHVRIR
jgi:vacuolar-type H+-ATPase subunit E/Vma4